MKDRYNEYQKEYQKTERGKTVQKRYLQSEKGKQAKKKYNASTKGKITCSKENARKKGLGWILMFPNPFNESMAIEYHHITDAYVVAIPSDLHQLYLGKQHREKLVHIINQIYMGE